MFPVAKNHRLWNPKQTAESLYRCLAYAETCTYIGSSPELAQALSELQNAPLQCFFSSDIPRDTLVKWHESIKNPNLSWQYLDDSLSYEFYFPAKGRILLLDGIVAELSMDWIIGLCEIAFKEGFTVVFGPVYNGHLQWQPSHPDDGLMLKRHHQWLVERNHSGEKAPADMARILEGIGANIQKEKFSQIYPSGDLLNLINALYRCAYDAAPIPERSRLTTWAHTRRYYAQVQKLQLHIGFAIIIGRPIIEDL